MQLQNLEDTQHLAQSLVAEYVPFVPERPLVVGITGPLGAGKTTLTQAIAQALDIAEQITSPTYTYLEEYPFVYPGFKGMLYHMDAWRIEDGVIFERLAIAELIQAGNLVVIEWYDQVASWLEPVLEDKGARVVRVELAEKNGQRTAAVEVCEYGK